MTNRNRMTTIAGSGTIMIREDGGDIQYEINGGGWNTVAAWPITINNTDTGTMLIVSFMTDLVFTNVNQYFICGTDMIQFGDRTLRNDGAQSSIEVLGVPGYAGLIQNGYDSGGLVPGKNNINICNLFVAASGGSTLVDEGGWIGQRNYANGAIDNHIVNCGSNGAIPLRAGGIVGAYSASNTNSILAILGCISSGSIGNGAGGIVGAYSGIGSNTLLTVSQSSSSGSIDSYGGGIFGMNCGTSFGDTAAIADYCYSTGLIGTDGGGMFGIYAGSSGGSAQAFNSYSTGNINGGGIFAPYAADTSGSAIADNCYTTGAIASGCGGIFGSNYGPNANSINCYTSGTTVADTGGIWAGSSNDDEQGSNNYAEGNHSSSGWNDTNASAYLSFTPSGIQTAGDVWVTLAVNTPYRIRTYGFTPYNLENISLFYGLNDLYFETIIQGGSTNISILPAGYTYTIVAINNNDPILTDTITINSTTGQITATNNTPTGYYEINVQSEINPYSITTFAINITEAPIPVPTSTLVITPCCNNPILIRPSPTTNNSSEVLTANASGRTIIQNVNTYYDAIANRSGTYLAKPVFGTYREYMEYVQSNN